MHPGVALPILKDAVSEGTTDDMKTAFPILAQSADPRADGIILEALQRLKTGVPLAAQTELLDAANNFFRVRDSRARLGTPSGPTG